MSGGSILVFTALAFLGMPTRTAIGTLKFAIAVLGLFSAGTYLRGGAVNVKLVPSLLLSSVIGSAIGSQIVVSLPDRILKAMVILLLCVGSLLSLKSGRMVESDMTRVRPWGVVSSVVAGVCLGVYIGMMGVASAILTILLLMFLFGLPLLQANGTAKMIIFVNNLVACIVYALSGHVDFTIGILTAVPIGIGAWVGAKTALRIGGPKLRIVFFLATAATFLKLLSEVI